MEKEQLSEMELEIIECSLRLGASKSMLKDFWREIKTTRTSWINEFGFMLGYFLGSFIVLLLRVFFLSGAAFFGFLLLSPFVSSSLYTPGQQTLIAASIFLSFMTSWSLLKIIFSRTERILLLSEYLVLRKKKNST